MTSTAEQTRPRITEVALRRAPTVQALPAARVPGLHEFAGDPLDVLGALSVALVGLGSVGGRMALHLARTGVLDLLLVDPDRYSVESLTTHDAAPQDVGTGKAARIAARVKALAPDARVRVFAGPVEALDVLELLDVDVVLVATDNIPAELAAAQLCLRLGVPCLQASVHGETLTVQVRVSGVGGEDAACLGCPLGPEELAQAARGTRYACAGNGQGAGRALGPPTMSVSALCSLAASMATLELLRHVLELGARRGDAILEYNAYSGRSVVSPLRRDARCPLDHRAWERASILRPPHELSARELAAAAGFGAEPSERLALGVGGREWWEQAVCACGAKRHVARFGVPGRAAGRCSGCGERIEVPAVFRRRRPSLGLLGRRAGVALTRLGAGRPAAVLLETDGRAVLLARARHPGDAP